MPPPASTRLVFRSWTEQDTHLAEALWCDPHVTSFFGGAMTPKQAHARLHAEREREARLGIQYWPMFSRETGEFLGCAGLRPWSVDPTILETGVHLMRSAWGVRVGEEAMRSSLTYGFQTLGLELIVAGHSVAHSHSRKLLERLGFAYTDNILWISAASTAIDVCMWSITAATWHPPQSYPERRC